MKPKPLTAEKVAWLNEQVRKTNAKNSARDARQGAMSFGEISSLRGSFVPISTALVRKFGIQPMSNSAKPKLKRYLQIYKIRNRKKHV